MALSTTTARVAANGNGVTTGFTFAYKYVASADLSVYLYDTDTDEPTAQTLNVDYTVAPTGSATNGVYPGATVTFSTAPGSDKKVVIFRNPALTQEFDFDAESDPLLVLTRYADYEAMRMQAQNDANSRSFRLADGDYQTLPNDYTKADYANSALVFDASGDPMPGSTTTTSISAAMTPVVQAATLAAARDAMGLEIGADVQGYDAQLADVAGLTPTDSGFIVGNGTNFVVESGATARTSLGLGSIATQAASAVAITGGSIAGITDLAVADGGTGAGTGRGAQANLGGWYILGASAAAVSHTGDTNETTLATIAVPAGAIGANGMVRVWTLWSYTNSANNKVLKVKLSSTSFLASTQTTTATFQAVSLIRNRNSAASQVGAPFSINGLGSSTSAVQTGTVDTTSAQDITITATLANSGETITLEAYLVELFYKA